MQSDCLSDLLVPRIADTRHFLQALMRNYTAASAHTDGCESAPLVCHPKAAERNEHTRPDNKSRTARPTEPRRNYNCSRGTFPMKKNIYLKDTEKTADKL